MVDPWPMEYLGPADGPGRRLNRPLTYVRHSAAENGYAHPVEGLIAIVDLDRGEVLEVEDHGIIDTPAAGEYTTAGMQADGNSGTRQTEPMKNRVASPMVFQRWSSASAHVAAVRWNASVPVGP